MLLLSPASSSSWLSLQYKAVILFRFGVLFIHQSSCSAAVTHPYLMCRQVKFKFDFTSGRHNRERRLAAKPIEITYNISQSVWQVQLFTIFFLLHSWAEISVYPLLWTLISYQTQNWCGRQSHRSSYSVLWYSCSHQQRYLYFFCFLLSAYSSVSPNFFG